MATERALTYQATGVLDNTQLGLSALLKWIDPTARFRSTGAGRRVVDVGFFASVVEITPDLGLALCTDGVGSKVLVADRKSTRLNSSHLGISYAVFCLK